MPSNLKTYYPKDRKAWRRWLQQHHTKEPGVWLIYYKKNSGKSRVSYNDAVEEALCFGWIDSTVYKRDEVSRYQFFAKRNPRGNWSTSNKERVKRLSKQGFIMPAGQAMIDLAKKNGSWKALDKAEKMEVPEDLQKLLEKNKKALKHFQGFSSSSKKIILSWIYTAKRPETRMKRIKKVVELAAKNIRANQ